ncbi:FadR/GntR family transcriptional regulator [Aestuariibius sp. 2305UL40-4]|uniref:FadR/GntR family transcriptional regulator n=1 Tax=Aestuariibius violaceus TaxID=3234132 RepID=UPI00345EDF1C
MPFEKVQSDKLSTGIVRQIEGLILRGILRPGDRLPGERDLAAQMAVSRPSLREALGELQENGLLESRPGAGVYVADVLGSAFSPALIDLFARHDAAIFDVLAFRRDVEGIAAARAATLASDEDLAVIDRLTRRMAEGPRSPEDEARLDTEFHLAIIEAGHNIVMLHMMRSMYELLRDGVIYNRQVMFHQSPTRDTLLAQHQAINAALQARDPERAKAAIATHLDTVEAAIRSQRRAEANAGFAKKRMEQEARRG